MKIRSLCDIIDLLINGAEEKTEQAQWISLPCETEITCDFYNGICLDFQSALPNLTFDDTSKVGVSEK